MHSHSDGCIEGSSMVGILSEHAFTCRLKESICYTLVRLGQHTNVEHTHVILFWRSSFYKNKKKTWTKKTLKLLHFELFSSYTCADIVFLCMATSIVQENNATGKVVMSLFGLNVTDAGSLMRSLWSLRHDLLPTKLVSISQLLCTLLLYSK